ncbi:MAG: type II toxin-antitoxin system death-on-curing family toxin [Candidatus Aenigmarchaeota archaeon]|nr:type II toxin-antitoxin system death-on-curing family toxin [Candidatus Aenigmarchaeota archaeon]
MTNHLTFDNIIELNRVLVNQFGDGPAGVKDEGTLDFILDKASMSEDFNREAAVLLYEINTKHPFWGANKRTAFEASKIFLLANGIKLKAGFEEAVEFVNDMAQGKVNYQQTLRWLKEHAVK